jgi:hypothetical protein
MIGSKPYLQKLYSALKIFRSKHTSLFVLGLNDAKVVKLFTSSLSWIVCPWKSLSFAGKARSLPKTGRHRKVLYMGRLWLYLLTMPAREKWSSLLVTSSSDEKTGL